MKLAKTFKKACATTIAAVSAVCTFTSFSAYAADAAPRVYVDLNYVDEDTARADVIFENFDELIAFGFHMQVGEGWDIQPYAGEFVEIEKSMTIAFLDVSAFTCTYKEKTICAAFSCDRNVDLNGVVFSFYLNKTSSFNPNNSWVKYVDSPTAQFATLDEATNDYVYSEEIVDKDYRILEAYEYLVGDVDNSGFISPVDASAILVNYNQNGVLNVNSIKTNYKQFFANATCAATPDATQDGIINTADADEINSVYSLISMGATEYDSMAGKYDYFEIYND